MAVCVPPGHSVVPVTSVDVPDGFLGADELEARFPYGTSDVTKSLAVGVLGRTIPSPQHVTDLIQQGANPNIKPQLRKKGSKVDGFGYSLLTLAVHDKADNTFSAIHARQDDDDDDDDDEGDECRVVLPQWPSDELQAAIMKALIDGGADVNATYRDAASRPIWVTIRCGNEAAFKLLMAQGGIDLESIFLMALPPSLHPILPQYQEVQLSMFRHLITREPTLATERANGGNLVHHAAGYAWGHHSQSFIDTYLDLITANGADMTADDGGLGETPLHYAAVYGSPYVADYLCRKLPADQINRRDGVGETPLSKAAEMLDHRTQQLQLPDTPEVTRERWRAKIDDFKLAIRTLLRAGADITTIPTIPTIPTATEKDRRQRQLVLTEYPTVLNELPTAVMSAVNAALAPHRSLAALLTPRLAVGPQEAAIFGWRIASYLFDMDAAKEAIGEAIGVRHTDMARRVCAAAEHFVRSAVYQASSNREVVGGTADVGGQVVRVPQLQCFVVGGVGGRKMELREVVQRAIVDEAAKWGLTGEIDNGFSKNVAAVVWGAVGWVERGRDGRETFRSLQLT
ncbi:unnamed protein product [Vitrella brassicaformis CCMP3155]|uniref:Uncharacterized protein n=1 Tax=Vitrella brassicaformis (strain CCMP3155) TaxID=1169540 RepID=A0A0G4EDE3_VITBC|nr:unnamed protein product [Vitrella brassicaformis CCMP3155]|eukprot:CEL93385.1 unnamed protein product [Vitrella brassicaformis CCMP3155]